MKKTDIMVKKAVLNNLEDIFRDLETKEECLKVTYGKTGKQVQSRKWNRETQSYDYLFDDDGKPIMEDEWADVPKTEFNDDDKAELKAIEIVKAALEKLI